MAKSSVMKLSVPKSMYTLNRVLKPFKELKSQALFENYSGLLCLYLYFSENSSELTFYQIYYICSPTTMIVGQKAFGQKVLPLTNKYFDEKYQI